MMINSQRSVRVSIAPLKRFLAEACELLRVPTESVTVSLVTNSMMARWNLQYRAKPAPTDVLSFAAGAETRRTINRAGRRSTPRIRSRRPGKASPQRHAVSGEDGPYLASYLGDVAIAPAVARQNARELGRTLDDEMKILILHGLLHLLGYDHETDHGQMARRERRLRRSLGLT